MVQCHGSQCGFCTPGFVMSLFGMYQNHVCQGQSISRAQAAQEELSGNLCRCTGYRPILDAAQHMAQLPPMAVNEAELLQKLELLALTSKALEANLTISSPPTTLAELLAARAAHPRRRWWLAAPMWGCGSPSSTSKYGPDSGRDPRGRAAPVDDHPCSTSPSARPSR
jgi:xanthine dehydrogenase iron-sulfur cluster and FAD-binding subunit A